MSLELYKKYFDLSQTLLDSDYIEHYEEDDVHITSWIDNWDFKNSNINLFTHKIHRYPAMFIPQVIRKLLVKYSNKEDKVLDIFCGSGTLLVEGMLLERITYGIELNPLAILISKVKTTPINIETLISEYQNIVHSYFDENRIYLDQEFKNIDFWFTIEAKKNLSKLVSVINQIADNSIKDFFRVCLSEIIRDVSLCKNGGFKLHRDLEKEKKSVLKGLS